jgi:hypothetical protein
VLFDLATCKRDLVGYIPGRHPRAPCGIRNRYVKRVSTRGPCAALRRDRGRRTGKRRSAGCAGPAGARCA